MNVSLIKARLSVATLILALCLGSKQVGCQDTPALSQARSAIDFVLATDVEWTPLNPLRGDKGPKAATLWGDRNGEEPTGFLVKFVDGFSSPPHIHNVTYRGVVIDGLVHNDDPGAAKMWMPAGSFWTQPAGEVHITAAKGSSNVAYIEIDEAPYLVLPTDQAFDHGERPINIHSSNIVWIDPPAMQSFDSGTKMAFLWGNPQDSQPNGTLFKFRAGTSSELRSVSTLRAVVITGGITYEPVNGTGVQTLGPGSYFRSEGGTQHRVACEGEHACVLYIRTRGALDVS